MMNEKTAEYIRMRGQIPKYFGDNGPFKTLYIESQDLYFYLQSTMPVDACAGCRKKNPSRDIVDVSIVGEVEDFIKNHCIGKYTDEVLGGKEIYNRYKEVCFEKGTRPMAKSVFCKVFLRKAFREQMIPGLMMAHTECYVKVQNISHRVKRSTSYLNIVLV